MSSRAKRRSSAGVAAAIAAATAQFEDDDYDDFDDGESPADTPTPPPSRTDTPTLSTASSSSSSSKPAREKKQKKKLKKLRVSLSKLPKVYAAAAANDVIGRGDAASLFLQSLASFGLHPRPRAKKLSRPTLKNRNAAPRAGEGTPAASAAPGRNSGDGGGSPRDSYHSDGGDDDDDGDESSVSDGDLVVEAAELVAKANQAKQQTRKKNSLGAELYSLKAVTVKRTKETMYQCTYCPYTTSRTNNLSRHFVNIHRDLRIQEECCGVKFSSHGDLTDHQRTAHNRPIKLYCYHDDCKKKKLSFSRKALLKRHVENVHTQEKKYKCEFCPYTSSNRSNLLRHRSTKHAKQIEIMEEKERQQQDNVDGLRLNPLQMADDGNGADDYDDAGNPLGGGGGDDDVNPLGDVGEIEPFEIVQVKTEAVEEEDDDDAFMS